MKRILIFLSALLLLGAGYFTYDKWVKDADLSLWSFVPGNSILIYESQDPLKSFEEVKETSIWKNLAFIERVRSIDKSLELLDSLSGKGNFRKVFDETPTIITLNVTGSQSFDFLYVVEIQTLLQQTFISKAQSYFEQSGHKKHTREYEGFTITEMVQPGSDQGFTYIFYKNYFIGSFSAFLVEDAIRTVAYDERGTFQQENPELSRLTKLERDQGNLYVNTNRFQALVGAFIQGNQDLNLARSSFLDLKVTDKSINLNGFTFTADQNHYLSTFSNATGGDFDIAEVIPNDASWFYHFSVEDPVVLGESLNTYFRNTTPEVLDHQDEILRATDFDVNFTYNLIDEEMGLVTLESSATGNQNQLLILEVKDMGEALKYYNSVAERHMTRTGDSIYTEQYGDYQIRKLPVDRFPYALLGNVASDFRESYYLQFRNYLIFSNSLSQLKNFTIAIAEESTWSKSLRINEFLEQTSKEAVFSLFVNTPRAWKQMLTNLKPSWRDFFENQQFTFRNLEFIATQFSTVDKKFYTNVTVYQPDLPNRSIPERIRALRSITLPDFINTKPWLVQNHNNRLKEVLVQDTANAIYLIGNDFSVLWDLKLSEPITSPIKQIDYYKNTKLQYVFSTKSAIHLIDRTGTYLPEYPKKLAKVPQIKHFNVIDYDNTKNYRFTITDPKGNVYLTDKDLKPLKGWNPKAFEKRMAQAPQHRRIDGKDVILILQQNGTLRLLNRRGQHYSGFPIETDAVMADEMFIKNANSLEDATITLLTKGGELIEINFNGMLIRREQLYKPGANTEFSFLKDVSGDSYLVLRKTDNTYEVLSPEGKVLFSKDYFSSTPLYTQYYRLGGGTEFVVFVDPGGTYLYLYDRSGNLLTGRPLTATQPISIMQYENEFQIYRAVDRQLELLSITF